MNKETLLNFLKDNLSISITEYDEFYEKGIKVELIFDDEVISEDSVTLETNYDI